MPKSRPNEFSDPAHRKELSARTEQRGGLLPAGSRTPAPPGRLLIIDADATVREFISLALQPMAVTCDTAQNPEECRAALSSGQYDVIIVDAHGESGRGLQLVRDISDARYHTRAIVLSHDPNVDTAIEAMRSGAVDLVPKPIDEGVLVQRVTSALEHAHQIRDQERRVQRLKRICKRLNTAREEVTKQVDVLCHDLIDAYQELADQMNNVSLASEFNSLIRQELDVEALLRTTLEYLLTKTGPTNAAVFLPTGHSDYNLGAYVNYDVPRDAADVLLDHLADILAPRFADDDAITHCTSSGELERALGEDAGWLADCTLVVCSCRTEDECLAVMAFFRDQENPFTPELLQQLDIMRDLFAQQLARIVRIHHRHLGSDKWPGFDVGEAEDETGGLAA